MFVGPCDVCMKADTADRQNVVRLVARPGLPVPRDEGEGRQGRRPREEKKLDKTSRRGCADRQDALSLHGAVSIQGGGR
jgi:hypothetical protein